MRDCANPATGGSGCGPGLDWGSCDSCHHSKKRESLEDIHDRIDPDDPILDEVMDAWIEGNYRTPKMEG